MREATELVKSIRDDLSEIDNEIRAHPYPDMLMKGKVSLEALKAFPGNQYAIITSDLRSIAFLVHRFGDAPSRDFFMEVLKGERLALDGVIVMGRKLEMTLGDLAYYEVSAKGIAYTTFMAWQALYASPAEFAAGILVNFAAWGHNCGRVSTALRKSYSFTEEDTVFLDGFANMPPLDAAAMVIVQDGLEQGVEPAQIHRGARLFQAYEKMFWDAMLEIARGE
jgi:thiaminase